MKRFYFTPRVPVVPSSLSPSHGSIRIVKHTIIQVTYYPIVWLRRFSSTHENPYFTSTQSYSIPIPAASRIASGT